MPSPEKEFFAQKTEKKEPLKEKEIEKQKEAKALELAQEIKRIHQEMKEKGETIEGYQRIKDLLKEIENLYFKRENYEITGMKIIEKNRS